LKCNAKKFAEKFKKLFNKLKQFIPKFEKKITLFKLVIPTPVIIPLIFEATFTIKLGPKASYESALNDKFIGGT